MEFTLLFTGTKHDKSLQILHLKCSPMTHGVNHRLNSLVRHNVYVVIRKLCSD